VKTVTRQIKDKTQPIRTQRMAKAAEGMVNTTSETSIPHSVSQSSIPQQSQEASSQPQTQVGLGQPKTQLEHMILSASLWIGI
jgi:hypothetical protein